MKKMVFASLCASLFFASCKKDTGSAPQKAAATPPAPAPVYMPAKVGNYWVYEAYLTDTINGEVDQNHLDSLWIDRDSIANGKTYYHFATLHSNVMFDGMMPLANQWATDSAGFVCPSGYKKNWFDAANLHDTMRVDTMTWGFVLLWVPVNFMGDVTLAGTYSGVSIQTWGRHINPIVNYSRPFAYTDYAPDVGIVRFKSGFANDPTAGNLWKLVRYHLN